MHSESFKEQFDVGLLTTKQTQELLADCIDNLTEAEVLKVLQEKLSFDQIDELAAWRENEDR